MMPVKERQTKCDIREQPKLESMIAARPDRESFVVVTPDQCLTGTHQGS